MSQTVVPQLRMTDVQRSIRFYVDGLGFKIDWEHRFGPRFPVFMQLTRAGQTIFLTEHAGDCQVGGAAYFVVPDVDACHREFTTRGVVPTEPPSDTPGLPREMVITDPDGNRLRFATHCSTPAPPRAAQEPGPRPQPLICVRDVEASSHWYQRLLECDSDHGGREYERLVRHGRLILQLHDWNVEHDHGPIGDPDDQPYGNGVLLWFEVDEIDAAIERAAEIRANVVKPRHRNPASGGGGPNHWELWLRDPDGYTVVLATPDGSAGTAEQRATQK